jgi:hypothetical protein
VPYLIEVLSLPIPSETEENQQSEQTLCRLTFQPDTSRMLRLLQFTQSAALCNNFIKNFQIIGPIRYVYMHGLEATF